MSRTSADKGFASFYEEAYSKTYAAAYTSTGNTEHALDATQEAFARAWARWRTVKDLPWREGWVIRTAMNVAHDFHRKMRREVGDISKVPTESPTANIAEHLEIAHALARLPRRQREATVLHYLADLPVLEVAQLMGISNGGVKANLAKARVSLERLLEVNDERSDQRTRQTTP